MERSSITLIVMNHSLVFVANLLYMRGVDFNPLGISLEVVVHLSIAQ